jgi:molybdate transport system substrate-binding protein
VFRIDGGPIVACRAKCPRGMMRGSMAAAMAVAMGMLAMARPVAASDEILVFAAASLKTALDDVAASWAAESGNKLIISLGGSSSLAKQIQEGAPADVFISASVDWMDVLDRGELIDHATRRDVLRNRIVLIAHGSAARVVEIKAGFDLAGMLKDGKLAMAMVDSVPAGIYGKAALAALGVWEAVAPSVAQTDNVRAALTLVERGEAPLGIVYATDAAASDDVSIIGTFPAELHPPIVYPAAVVSESKRKTVAASFLEFLVSPKAKAVFKRHGFGVMEQSQVN